MAWVCLAFQAPVWFMVHLYLENIMPDNYGISKSCCFCLRSCSKPEATEEKEVLELPDLESNLAQAGQNNRHKRIGTEKMNMEDPIQLRRVTMKFGGFKAVDSLSLSVRRNEIMAVLGHNGAGKTTAIYMLTGMLQMSSGEALINGRSVKHNIDEVR